MSEYIHVGLDVHQNSITAAILSPGSDQAEIVRLSGDLMKTRRLFRRLARKRQPLLMTPRIRKFYEHHGIV